ncbi:MAG: L,D-transpeptidase [Candidatus Portnoybacteria bacterium]|nr:L,D-transpeptidase [Candidatus Portnoybacteria bacterium]
MPKKLKNFLVFLLPAGLFVIHKSAVALAQGYQLQIPIPKGQSSVSGPSQYIQMIFKYGLSIVGSGGNETRKKSGKEWMWGAVMGLVLLLCSWLILYTINPQLTKLSEPALQRVTIAGTVDNYDPVGAGEYKVPPVGKTSPPSLDNLSQYQGQPGTTIVIDKSDKMLYLYKDGQLISQAPVGIGTGDKTGALTGGVSGDKITPVGDFVLTKDIRSSPNGVFSGEAGSNMGPVFLGISANDQNGNYRGIGIHGSGDDSLRGTNGCIRLRNADVIELNKVVHAGTPVKIRN